MIIMVIMVMTTIITMMPSCCGNHRGLLFNLCTCLELGRQLSIFKTSAALVCRKTSVMVMVMMVMIMIITIVITTVVIVVIATIIIASHAARIVPRQPRQ